MANKTIYLVQGHSGSYDYTHQWVAKAFFDKDKAEIYKNNAENFANQMIEKYKDESYDYNSDIDPNPFDSHMSILDGICFYLITESILDDGDG